MLTKNYVLITLCCISLSLNAMQPVAPRSKKRTESTPQLSRMITEINKQDQFGNTPLHIVVMGPEQRKVFYPDFDGLLSPEMRQKDAYDLRQSSHAAVFIYLGARLNIKNAQGYTAWHYAASNNTYYPKIHAVIHAASVLQQPQPKHTRATINEAHQVLINHVADEETLQARNDQALPSLIRHIKQNKSHAASFAYALKESGLVKPCEEKN